MPALELLAVTCMLMAAKLEQSKVPSQSKMIKIAEVNWSAKITKPAIVALERDIVLTLDFELRNTSPLVSLGRFLRLFELDLVEMCPRSLEISSLANQICLQFMHCSKSLDRYPSQIAAGALLMAIQIQ